MAHAPGKIVSGYFDLQSYIGTKYRVLGIKAKTQRDLCRAGYSFSKQPIETQLAIWDHIWKQADIHEVMSQAIIFVDQKLNRLDPATGWKVVKGWVDRIDNWAHSDMLSKFFGRWMDKIPEAVFPQMVKWNSSKNPWERRQSMVSLVGYTKSKQPVHGIEEQLWLVKPLLKDPDYFVQKGVGWALRELGVKYPSEVWMFLKAHVKEISSVAFSAAAEKLDRGKKDVLKGMRKKKV